MNTAPSNVDDEFEKWKREVREAEIEAEKLKNGSGSSNVGAYSGVDDHDGVPESVEGEEEFTDDDGTTYKWDRSLRAWVPQVGAWQWQVNYFLLIYVKFVEQILN